MTEQESIRVGCVPFAAVALGGVLPVSGWVVLPALGGVLPVSGAGAACFRVGWGWCLPRGGGCLPRGGVSQHALRQTPREQND